MPSDRERVDRTVLPATALQSAIFNSSNFSSIATDSNGVIQIFNVGAERMLGYAADEVVNRLSPADLSDPRELVLRAETLSIEFGTPIAPGFAALVYKATRQIEDIYELTYIRKDGSSIPALLSVTSLRDDDGGVIGYLLIGTDNTIRKQGEADRTALLRTIHLHSIVSVADLAGRIIEVNDSFCAISGYSREELLGKTHQIVNSGVHPPQFWVELWLDIANGKSWRGEICNRSKEGSLYWVDSIIAPFRSGGSMKFISIRTDITAAKLSEGRLREATLKAEKASLAKSAFLANMSHEIRTPMNAIVGMTHLALKASSDSRQQGYLTKISVASDSLLNIINDILDFSKIEAGMLHLENIPFSLAGLLNKVNDILAFKAQQRNVSFRMKLAESVPGFLVGDPFRLEQILINLANNAIKFSHECKGSVSLAVTAEDCPGDTKLVKFSVCDSGIGMSPDQVSNLFQSFNQSDSSFTRKYGGTGLGLAISKQLADLMGGTLSAQSELGQGSTFCFSATFTIPRPEDPETILSQSSDPSPQRLVCMDTGPSPVLAGRRVLLAEDNQINRDLATELLQDLGIHVTIAVNGRDAVDRVNAEFFDLVLMDIQMPLMDGLNATQLIRQDIDLRRLPVLAMTAHAMSGDRERSLNAGMNDHMTKPINPQVLKEMLIKWMPKSVVQANTIEAPFVVDQAGLMPGLLPPFDIPAALARTNGKPALLHRMLLNFNDQYQGCASELRRQIADGKMEEASRLVHSLKGSAATLEANDLAIAAGSIEQALRAGAIEGVDVLTNTMEAALNLATAAARSVDRRIAPPSPSASRVKTDRVILVVDDQADDLELLKDLFGSSGELLYAENGLAALQIAADRAPDLILLDVMMPGIDGYETLRRLKAEPKTCDIPVMFITALADEEKVLEMGACDYVTKPFKPLAVYARVTHHIDLRRAQKQVARLTAEKHAAQLAKEEQEAAERLRKSQAAVELRDEFLAQVSHEFRSPLSSIYLFSENMADGLAGNTTQEQDQQLRIIQKNVRQLQSMIDDLLEVASSKTGKLHIQLEGTPVDQAVRDAVNTCAANARAKNVDVSFVVPSEFPSAYADPVRLLQVLIILTDNAIKFTPAGGSVKMRASAFETKPSYLLLEVSDTGCGIKPELLKRIFENHYQVTESSQNGRRGLGLGLHIAKDLVTRQGGALWATSVLGSGSVFSFTLPAFVGQRSETVVLS